jgi:hypothetical protein
MYMSENTIHLYIFINYEVFYDEKDVWTCKHGLKYFTNLNSQSS